MSNGFNPYHKWLGIPVEKCPPTFYDMLQIEGNEQDRDVIQMAVERQKSHLEQFRTGGKQSKLVDRLIYELDEAEMTLLNREMRAEYDQRVLPVRRRKNRKRAAGISSLPENQNPAGEGSGLLQRYAGIVSILTISFSIMAASVYLIPWKRVDSGGSSQSEVESDQGKSQTTEKAAADGKVNPEETTDSQRPALLVSPFTQQEAVSHQQEWARFLKQELLETNSLGMGLAMIPPGEFKMGNTAEEVERILQAFADNTTPASAIHQTRINSGQPQHDVVISRPFRMSQQEVTQAMFASFIRESGYQTDAQKDGKGGYAYDDGQLVQSPDYNWQTDYGLNQPEVAPVVNVSWNDANAFCKWLSEKEGKTYRLPTEAEWEYACRAGTTTLFSFGDAWTPAEAETVKEYAWFTMNTSDVGEKYPHAVMAKQSNPFGLFDMHGNVYEWCQDWYNKDYYSTLAGRKTVDPTGPSQSQPERVIRGGSWFRWTMDIRSGYRDRITADNRNLNVGFRVVCDVE